MPNTQVSPEDRARRRTEILGRALTGQSQRQIAEALGVSRSLVQKELRAARAEGAEVSRALTNPIPYSGARAATAVAHTGDGTAFGWNSTLKTVLPPPDHFSTWRRLDLDRDTWSKADAHELVSLLINVSPDASRAVWDWLRLLNSGHEIVAHKIGKDDPDERAQAVLDDFIDRLERYHGSFKVLAGRLFMASITRGAFFAELVMDKSGRTPVDIATPDPASVRFRRAEDPERGEIWEPGQWQGGKWVSFNIPTIRYIPLDPEPGNPYGRPMIAPAVFPCVFLIGLMHDLRRVVAQQGYPRTDVVVNLEKLRAAFADLEMDEFEAKVAQLLTTIKRDMASLEPDDTYVHTDPIEVNRASGAIDSSVMRGAGDLISALERMAMRALKTMPLLMGTTDGVSEANANRQWEIFAAGIKTVQHYAEKLLESLLDIALQSQGIQADVKVTFAEIRAAEELRDEQTLELKLRNAETAERLGYMERDEASEHAVGHEAATEKPEPEPEPPAPEEDEPGTGQDGNEATPEDDADPGSDRGVRVIEDARLHDIAVTHSGPGRTVRGPDDAWPGQLDGVGPIDDARLADAIETWEDVFAEEDEAALLEAEVDAEDDEDDAA